MRWPQSYNNIWHSGCFEAFWETEENMQEPGWRSTLINNRTHNPAVCACVWRNDVRGVSCTVSDICRLFSIRGAESASLLAGGRTDPDPGDWHHTHLSLCGCVCVRACLVQHLLCFIFYILNEELLVDSRNWWVFPVLKSCFVEIVLLCDISQTDRHFSLCHIKETVDNL